jgi:hypothetical protein
MMCPLCKTNLINDEIEKSFYYEDAAGGKNFTLKHICPNDKCILSQSKSYWTDDGDFFSNDLNYSEMKKLFPHDQYAALNSFAKRMEIDVYGKGLKRKIYLSEWWTLKWLKPMIEFSYKGDDMGNVLSRSWKLKFLYKDRGSDDYSTYYTAPIVMCYRLFKSQYKRINGYKKNKTKYTLLEMYRWYMGHESTWERKFPKWFFRKFHSKYLNWSKNAYDFFEHLKRNKEITEDFFTFWYGKLPPDFDILSEMIKNNCNGDYLKQKIRERKLKRILS